jgi:hypothetical protein
MDEPLDTRLLALRARMKAHGKVEMTLSGRSMEPYLFAGDKALVVPCTKLSLGHIYLFKKTESNELVIHRLIRLVDSIAILKGDQTGVFECMPVDSLIGEVSALMLKGSLVWVTRIYPTMQTRLIRYLSESIGNHCSNHEVGNKQLHVLVCKIMDWLCTNMRKRR